MKGCLTSLIQVTFFINSSVMEQCVQVLTLGDIYVLYNIYVQMLNMKMLTELVICMCSDVDNVGCLCPGVDIGWCLLV